MPTSKRDSIKRKHTAISNALLRCQGWAVELHDMFLEYHPDYAQGYLCAVEMLEQTRLFIEKMKDYI